MPVVVTMVVIPMLATGGGDYGKKLANGRRQGPTREGPGV